MIIEFLVDLCIGLLRGLFAGFEILNLPLEVVGTLSSILSFGVWIVGADIMGIFIGSVVFWWGIHTSIGLAVWLWKMLPLT